MQTIGFLSHLRANKIYGPFLVIGPLSTLPNWVNEFKRWSPEQPVILYHGSKAERAELRQKALSGGLRLPPETCIMCIDADNATSAAARRN